MTPNQIAAMQWLDHFPNHKSRWLQNGKSPRSVDFRKWNEIELAGARGMIRIAATDWRAISDAGFIAILPTPDRQFALNDAGRAALSAATDSLATRTSSGVAASTPTPIPDKLDAKVTT